MADEVFPGFTVIPVLKNTDVSIAIEQLKKDENEHPIFILDPWGSEYTILAGRDICVQPGSMYRLTKGYKLEVRSEFTRTARRDPSLSQAVRLLWQREDLVLRNNTQVACNICASAVICTIQVKCKYRKSSKVFFVFAFLFYIKTS